MDSSNSSTNNILLRRAQLRLLEILKVFDEICKTNNIQYWLIAGTLLGAVRHKGFIPWDDDIDVAVCHKDLKKIRKILNKELPDNLALQDTTTDKKYYLPSVIKIRDRNSFFPVPTHKPFKHQGLFIDIIPMEKIPSQRFKRFVFNLNKHPYLRQKEIAFNSKSKNLKGLFLQPLSFIAVNFAHWYSRISKTRNIGYNYLFYVSNCFEMQFDRDIFFPLRKMQFESYEFYVPNQSEKYLSLVYGDYMKLPPPELRQIHSAHIEIYD